MKKPLSGVKLIAALLALALAPQLALCKALRVVRYNVWGLPSPLLRHLERFKDIPAAINALDANVVLVQEAFNQDSRALARLPGFPYHAWGPSSGFLRLSSGLLILSKYPILVTDTVECSKCGGFDCFANKGAQFARQPRAAGMDARQEDLEGFTADLSPSPGMAGIAAPAGPGSVSAQEIVGAVSAESAATSEVKLQKPPAADPGAVAATASLGPGSLPSRLEVTAGADGLFNFGDVAKQIAVFGEARYRVTRLLQLGGSFAVRYQGDNLGSSEAAAQLLIGPTFNFGGGDDESIHNAFFVSPKVGMTVTRTTINNTLVSTGAGFTAAVSAGKRFALGNNVAYAPSIGVVKQFGSSLGFVIQPIAVSIFF